MEALSIILFSYFFEGGQMKVLADCPAVFFLTQTNPPKMTTDTLTTAAIVVFALLVIYSDELGKGLNKVFGFRKK